MVTLLKITKNRYFSMDIFGYLNNNNYICKQFNN